MTSNIYHEIGPERANVKKYQVFTQPIVKI